LKLSCQKANAGVWQKVTLCGRSKVDFVGWANALSAQRIAQKFKKTLSQVPNIFKIFISAHRKILG